MNYVHQRNNPSAFDRFHHYIITLHDSTYKYLAESYTFRIDVLKARDEQWRSEIRTQRKAPLAVRIRCWPDALNPWAG